MPRNEQGGSSHDPHANLPRPMWERGGVVSQTACLACVNHPDVRFRKKTAMQTFEIKGGPTPGAYRACPRCDGGPRS